MTTRHGILSRPLLSCIAVVAGLVLSPGPEARGDDDAGIRQTVARVAYVSGNVAFSRGDDPDHWQDALMNVPLTVGDRLWTEKGARLELQASGARLFVAPETQLSILDLQEDVAQLSLSVGTAALRLHHLGEGEIFEVDTPNAAVTIRAPGLYKVRVDEDGNTRVDVSEGFAVAAVGRDAAELHGGDTLRVRGLDAPVYELEPLGAPDVWDRWVDERTRPGQVVVAARYVGGGIAGIEELDSYGRWERIPAYGWAWTPRAAFTGWTPYRDGRWIWQDPWGWTWVSREPWGWAPYHYGSWVFSSSRWYWIPVGPGVRAVRYAPARVVFVGAGPGGAIVRTGSLSYVGWFPVHPRDLFIPWWGAPAAVSVRNVPYVNRSYVTVVPRDTFVGGVYVREAHVRDARVVREISAAPVYYGPIPLVPTVASVRFATPAVHHELPRPPDKYLDRHVATSLPPPPPPPAFNTKLGVIQKNQGRPYHHPEAERLAPDRPHETRAITAAPHRSKGFQETRPPVKAPTHPPDAAAKRPTPAVKPRAAVEPPSNVQKAPPEKVHAPPEGAPKTKKAPVVAKPKTSATPKPEPGKKVPPEKKNPPDKPVS